ncbi:hypothetical protein PoB_000926300 [Plakobranchus ocellatus]|uniref:Uncharacterized protein n=1 Tax=Plakobranchus ocellatus TaxID=259542 RepID=A0AAV3YJS3_9GAST|nr:hypothetical protein PoB_000926300 [Plakobranchus ocellatus]
MCVILDTIEVLNLVRRSRCIELKYSVMDVVFRVVEVLGHVGCSAYRQRSLSRSSFSASSRQSVMSPLGVIEAIGRESFSASAKCYELVSLSSRHSVMSPFRCRRSNRS